MPKFEGMKKLIETYKNLPPWLRNKYVLTGLVFSIWMLFFDSNSWLTHRDLNSEIKELEEAKHKYSAEMEKDAKELNELKEDPGSMERLAREKYFMKKKEEEIFIISSEK